MNIRHLTWIAATLAMTAGCTLDLDQDPMTEPDVLRFSDIAGEVEADAMALAAVPDTVDALSETTSTGSGLLSALLSSSPNTRTGPDGNSQPFGGDVAYGEIVAVCDAPRRQLGTKIAAGGGFDIYDSNPRSTALRAHYITGFDDGCPRQFSAALIMMGDVGTHEVVRYLPGNRRGYNKTDSAYEAVKAGFCRVGHGKPCGSRLDALARATTFITVYETFGSRPRWAEILLHDGNVKAMDFKSL